MILNEGESRIVACILDVPNTIDLLDAGWFDPEGNFVPTLFVELNLIAVTRDDAGTYICAVTAVNGDRSSSSLTIVVLCEYCAVVYCIVLRSVCSVVVLSRWP